MCGTYSVARVTRRWPLVIFLVLMDIAGINAQILFYSNGQNHKVSRRIFLKNLAYDLMKAHLVQRANFPSLPKDISLFLQRYETTSEQLVQPSSNKRARCIICGRAKNVNTTIKCDSCKSFVCRKHVIISYSCEKCHVATTHSED